MNTDNNENSNGLTILENASSLTFTSIKISDGGMYECEANNNVDPSLKKFVFMNVRGKITSYETVNLDQIKTIFHFFFLFNNYLLLKFIEKII